MNLDSHSESGIYSEYILETHGTGGLSL